MTPAGTVAQQDSIATLASLDAGASQALSGLQLEPPPLPPGVASEPYQLRFDLVDLSGGGEVAFSSEGNAPKVAPAVVGRARMQPCEQGSASTVNLALMTEALGLEHYYHYRPTALGAGMSQLTNVNNGNSVLRWTPFASPGRGLSTIVDITYNSIVKRTGPPLGDNFGLSISSLTQLGQPIDIHPKNADDPQGNAPRWVRFVDADGTPHQFDGEKVGGSIVWHPPPGVHLYLRALTGDPLGKWAFTRPDDVTFYYDADGFPTAVTDRNGNTLTYELEAVAPAEDPGQPGKRVAAFTDAAGNDSTPAPGRSFTLDYYSKEETNNPKVRGNVKAISDHDGSKLTFDYYDDGNLLRLTQEGGLTADLRALPDRSFTFTYTTSDSSGPAIPDANTRRDPPANTSNQSDQLFGVIDPRGAETTFSYVTSGENKWKLASLSDRAGTTTTYQYDIDQRITTVLDDAGRPSRFAYDCSGRVGELQNPAAEVTTLAWGDDNHLDSITEPHGVTTSYDHNPNGYLTEVTDQQGHATTLTYDDRAGDATDPGTHLSFIISKTAPKGNLSGAPAGSFRWDFSNDPAGNLVSVTSPADHRGVRHTSEYTWNLAGSADPGTLKTMTDANDHTTTFNDYDASGLPTKVTDAEGGISEFGYDADGLMVFSQDPNHHRFANPLEWEPVLEPENYRTYFFYDAFQRLGLVSAPKSTELERGRLIWSGARHDPNDNVTAELRSRYGRGFVPDGPSTTMAYDAMDRMVTATDPQGHATTATYDDLGRLATTTAPKGNLTGATPAHFTTTYGYDALDRVKSESRPDVDAAGNSRGALTTGYCFEALTGDLVATIPPKGAGGPCEASNDFATSYTYLSDHKLESVTDPNGNTTTYAYDANDNVSTITTPDRKPDGSATTVTTEHYHDERDLMVKQRTPFEFGGRFVTTAQEYDGAGNLIKSISPRAWDAAGTSDLPGAELRPSYGDYVESYSYDGLNRLTRTALPTGPGTEAAYVHHQYDANGNLTWTSLPVTVSDPAQFEPGGTHAASKSAAGTTSAYYDSGWIYSTKDPANPKTVFDYRAEGWQAERLVQKAPGEFDQSSAMFWSYFADGQLRLRTDRDGQRVSYDYDAHNNLTSAVDASGVESPGEKPIELSATYDSLDRIELASHAKTGGTQRHTLYAYDANSNLSSRVDDADSTTGSGGRSNSFTYDAADWLSTQVIEGNKASACDDDLRVVNAFKPTGLEDSRKLYRGTGSAPGCGWSTSPQQVTEWDYFANTKLDTLEIRNSAGAIVESHELFYEDPGGDYLNGHRVADDFGLEGPSAQPTECEPGGGAPRPCTARYAYDGRDRTSGYFDGHDTRIDYSFDEAARVTPGIVAAGNLTTEKSYTGASGLTGGSLDKTKTSSYDGAQLTEVTEAGSTSRYHYDVLGNLDCVTTSSGSAADCSPSGSSASANLLADYSYDFSERLVAYRSYSGGAISDKSNYTYDALDRVVSQTESHREDPSADRTTSFGHIGLSPLVASETAAYTSAPDVTKQLSYDAYGTRLALTNVAATERSYSFGYDVHGSTSVLVENTPGSDEGTVRASYGYRPYGDEDVGLTKGDAVTDASGETSDSDPFNPFRYSAKRYDSGSESLDMGARRFSSGTASFIQPDLYLGALANLGLSTDRLTNNRYALAAGNPVSYIESDGHAAIPDGTGSAKLARAQAKGEQIGSAAIGARAYEANTAGRYQYPAPQPPPAQEEDGGSGYNPVEFGKDVIGVVKGGGEGVVDTIVGAKDIVVGGWHCAQDFGGCKRNVGAFGSYAWNNSGEFGSSLWHSVSGPIIEDWKAGNPGEAIGRIIPGIIGTKGLDKLAKAGKATRGISGSRRFVVGSDGAARVIMQFGDESIELSGHALRRMTSRGVGLDEVQNVLGSSSPFRYYHENVWKTGYYDAASNIFVGTYQGAARTVIVPKSGYGYIQNLMKAQP
ncbi:MAG: RHS repeat-associated core domain-containing protein [Actinomycetota bacterium]